VARAAAGVRPRPLPGRWEVGAAAVGDAPVVVAAAAASVAVAVDDDVGGCAGCGFGGVDGGGGKRNVGGCSKPRPKTPSPDN